MDTVKPPKICVIGLAGQSAFLAAEHFPAPGETVSCTSLFFELGGKGYNQAVACARMGAATTFIGAVGRDAYGEACREALAAEGITPCLISKDQPTAFACIATDNRGENTVEVFPGAAKALSPEDLRSKPVMEQLRCCDWLLLQNELSADCLREACRIGRELGIRVLLNPAPAQDLPADVCRQCDWITPNYGEAKHLAGFSAESTPSAEELAEAFRRQGMTHAVITLGKDGALILDGSECHKIPSYRCGDAVDTTGAGDTFHGALAAFLAMGHEIVSAARFGAVAAGIGVTRHGAVGSIPRRTQVLEAYSQWTAE